MDRYIIFIEYYELSYADHFKLIYHDVCIQDCFSEDSDKLVQFLAERNGSFELDIVKTNDASEWDYQNALGTVFRMQSNPTPDYARFMQTLETVEERAFRTDEPDGREDALPVSVLFSGKCIPLIEPDHNTDDNIETTADVSDDKNADKHSKLPDRVQAIITKYERMNPHG